MKRKSSGFTIVELLIVIVIIGILAALVIVAYNGIQQRARNTSRIASAKEIMKIVAAYTAQEGKYPPAAQACIGTGYTDWDGNGSLDCYQSAHTFHPNAPLDAELQKVTNIPKVETSSMKGNSGVLYGGFFYYPNPAPGTVDGQVGRITMRYFLEGTNQNCGVPNVLTATGANIYVTNGAANTSSNNDGNTYCVIVFPEP